MDEEGQAVPDANPDQAVVCWSERLRSLIAKGQVFLACSDQTAVGFAGFIDSAMSSLVTEGIAYIVDMYVIPEARTSRAASQLFDAVLRRSVVGHSEVWTNTHKSNRRVQVLLRRKGFTPLPDFEIAGLKEQIYLRRKLQTAYTIRWS